MKIVNAVILCTVLLAACQQAAALSYEVCDSYGAEWVTDSPHLEGQYPFYSLIFTCNCAAPPLLCLNCQAFLPACMDALSSHIEPKSPCLGQKEPVPHICQGSLCASPDPCALLLLPAAGANIEGKMVDSCLANGTACGQPAADAYCQYIGFDGAVKGLFTTVLSDEPNRAVSGAFCPLAGPSMLPCTPSTQSCCPCRPG